MLVYWIWLSRLPRVTVKQKLLLLQIFRNPEELYEAHEKALCQIDGMEQKLLDALMNKDLTDARAVLKSCSEKNISILTYGDAAYPARLKNIEQPPLVLYYKGCLPNWENMPCIAVVGTRKASVYGIKGARRLGGQIASCGGLVISGGADGVDGSAMEGALAAGAKTVAVLGFGADIVYPARHRELFVKTEKQGCLLTEFIPGTPPHSWNFPQRNRIISGLSDGVLVVEAPERSGALNTARHAMDQGRDVFVMPGNADAQCCAGSNALLQQNAVPISSGWDILQEYESLYPQSVTHFTGTFTEELPPAEQPLCADAGRQRDKKSIDNRAKPGYSVKHDTQPELTEQERAVVGCMTRTPESVDAVIAKTALPPAKVLAILTRLAMKGVTVNHPGKCVSLK